MGLDIDGEFLAAVEMDGGRLVRAVSAELPPGVMAGGEVKDPDALTAQLKSLFKAHALPKHVRLGVSSQQIAVRQIELPVIEDQKERDAAVRFLAGDAIPMPLEDAVLDYQIVGCHLGGVTNLAVASGSTCTFTRPLTSDWSSDGDLSVPLADEIRLSIDYYMAQPAARRVSEVVLSGPGARSEELLEGLGKHLGLPVSAARPFGIIDTAPLPEGEDPYRHTIATGLALGAAA